MRAAHSVLVRQPRRCVRSCAALARSWVQRPTSKGGQRLRVAQLNALADCLARGADAEKGPKPQRAFRCDTAALEWETRRELLANVLLEHDADVIGLCEIDHHDDFFEERFRQAGYEGVFRKKRPPARDGCSVLWRTDRCAGALSRTVFLEQGARRTRAAQVALIQRVTLHEGGRSFVVCSTHLRARASEDFLRMQQAGEVVAAVADFARPGEPRMILADTNSPAPRDAEAGGAPNSVFEYFLACGYRCAYRSLDPHGTGEFPSFTTWAGWETGDYRAVCDHIFVSNGLEVSGVLDVPCSDKLRLRFPERFPNSQYPSDHMLLVADVVLPE